MAAPKGNQYALGQGGGRPREYDRVQIGKELLEWARQLDSLNLNKFCCTREPPLNPNKVIQWSIEDEEFRNAYEEAKAFLAARREEMLNGNLLHTRAYERNATVYDRFMRTEERNQKEFEANLKKDSDLKVSEKSVELYENLMKQITNRQLDSALNSAESNIKTDNKS